MRQAFLIFGDVGLIVYHRLGYALSYKAQVELYEWCVRVGCMTVLNYVDKQILYRPDGQILIDTRLMIN